ARNQGAPVENNFAEASKVINTGRWGHQTIADYELSRFAAYLAVMNGDPRKPEIAAAQAYFAVKTREAETQTAPALPQTYLEALKQLVTTVEENQALTETVEQQKPLVAQAETFRQSDGLRTIGDLANDLKAH